jgi:hypothetical protein
MLVYNAVASMVKCFAFGGSVKCYSSFTRCLEFFIYDGIRKNNSFTLKSNQLLKIDEKLLMQLTMGQNVLFFGYCRRYDCKIRNFRLT